MHYTKFGRLIGRCVMVLSLLLLNASETRSGTQYGECSSAKPELSAIVHPVTSETCVLSASRYLDFEA